MTDLGQSRQLEDVRQLVKCGVCLELPSDPRRLTCGHTFCFSCLKVLQATKKRCPICRAETIPTTAALLNLLPSNKVTEDLVKLICKHDPSTRKTAMKEELPDLSTLDISQCVHENVRCDRCHKENFIGCRYKCGICADFDLCEKCEAIQRAHTNEHILLKLKKAANVPPAFTSVLHPESLILGKTLSKQPGVHMTCSEEGVKAIHSCDECQKPLLGMRYKCGFCSSYDLCERCEKHSERIHDPKHVFMVLRHPVTFFTTRPQLLYNFYR